MVSPFVVLAWRASLSLTPVISKAHDAWSIFNQVLVFAHRSLPLFLFLFLTGATSSAQLFACLPVLISVCLPRACLPLFLAFLPAFLLAFLRAFLLSGGHASANPADRTLCRNRRVWTGNTNTKHNTTPTHHSFSPGNPKTEAKPLIAIKTKPGGKVASDPSYREYDPTDQGGSWDWGGSS